ncbi:MAG: hypothetical protein ACJAYC_001020, partial [Halieaceae bacterium]
DAGLTHTTDTRAIYVDNIALEHRTVCPRHIQLDIAVVGAREHRVSETLLCIGMKGAKQCQLAKHYHFYPGVNAHNGVNPLLDRIEIITVI